MNLNKTSVIIVAAGNATRMGGISKQLIKLDNKETICHTIEAFQNCSSVEEIIIVCKESDEKTIKELIETYKYDKVKELVYGGKMRSKSVENGLKVVSENCNYVAIHDGARPLIASNDIDKVINNAYKYKASAIGVQVKDTIKVVSDDGIINDTPERKKLIAIQTPQVFEKRLYIEAVNSVKDTTKEFTDDCSIVEEYGKDIYVTIGSYENIKITTPEDIEIANSIIKKRKSDIR